MTVHINDFVVMLDTLKKEGLTEPQAFAFLAYQQAERHHEELMKALEKPAIKISRQM